MEKTYPLLISIPHGGDKIPPEAEGKLKLGIEELIEDSDPFSREIYAIEGTARTVIAAEIFRAIVDLNRPPDDLPPANPDGVVKSHTCYNKEIYKSDYLKDAHFIKNLLSRYYVEYHNRIRQAVMHEDIKIAFDCHTMAAVAPDIAPDPGMDRPVITLGNNHGKACDFPATERLARSFREVFRIRESHVTINEPFAGGYITRTYGNRPVPWIQVEMNRCLYLDDRWFNPSAMEINQNRLKVLNARFKRVVELFFAS
jgi:N-formylglutamate deformylase